MILLIQDIHLLSFQTDNQVTGGLEFFIISERQDYFY